jgi:hypothetical protein
VEDYSGACTRLICVCEIAGCDACVCGQAELSDLWANRQYRVLAGGFSVGLGLFYSVLTLTNQLVAPYGYRSVSQSVVCTTLTPTPLTREH